MRYFIGILLLGLLFFSCTKQQENTTTYVQKGEIQLAKPRITVSNTMIDSYVTMKPEIYMEKLAIAYDPYGKNPTKEASEILHTQVSATKAGTYNFRAFHPDWKPSEITSITLYKKGFQPDKITWQTAASDTYKGQGEKTLFNNKKASVKFRDSQWVGFDSIAKASVSFPKKTYIESLTIGYLVDSKSWIFPPEQVTLYLNDKDIINVNIPSLATKEIVQLDDVKIPIKKELKTLTIQVTNVQKLPEWHPGKGAKAWLFMDEWIFN